jgi:hypothetical protein
MNKAARDHLKVPAIGHWLVILTLVLTAIMCVAPNARAQENNARQILKAMADYVAS